MDPLRSLDPETVKAAGFGTDRPLTDHPEILRNMLLRGDLDDWAQIAHRVQTEAEFRGYLRNVLTTVPYPEGWDDEDDDENAPDEFVESAAAALFGRMLDMLDEPVDISQPILLSYIQDAASFQDFKFFSAIEGWIKQHSTKAAIQVISTAVGEPKAGERPVPLKEFLEACYTAIDGTEDVDPQRLQSVKTTCRNLAQELLSILPELRKKNPEQPG